MKRFVCLGGWGEFTPEDPNVKDGDVCLFYSRKDEKLHIGKFFKSDENGSWGYQLLLFKRQTLFQCWH